LESFVAELTGHEDALFCATGTMTNQLALRCWLRGALQSVLLDERRFAEKSGKISGN
jgi:threonine aldolase